MDVLTFCGYPKVPKNTKLMYSGVYKDTHGVGGGVASGDLTTDNQVDDPCISGLVDSSTGLLESIIFDPNVFPEDFEVNVEFQDANINAEGQNDVDQVNYDLINNIITIDTDQNQATQEYVASTIAHEFMHAWINSLDAYEQYHNSFYNEIHQGYENYRSTMNGNDASHEVMARFFIPQMASVITNLFPGFNMDRATALAWGGLQDTEAWMDLLSYQERVEYDRILREENSASNTNAEGSPC